MAFVLDASVALAWVFGDEDNAYAETVLDLLAEEPGVVPSIWPLEVGNGLLAGLRRRRLELQDVDHAQSLLAALPIAVRRFGLNEVFDEVLFVAREHNLSVYDASYLAVAVAERSPLATNDVALLAAASAVGVPLVGR
jgi:predicted nucleic acid-binding protein